LQEEVPSGPSAIPNAFTAPKDQMYAILIATPITLESVKEVMRLSGMQKELLEEAKFIVKASSYIIQQKAETEATLK
jgi:hypothetical protein